VSAAALDMNVEHFSTLGSENGGAGQGGGGVEGGGAVTGGGGVSVQPLVGTFEERLPDCAALVGRRTFLYLGSSLGNVRE
jgi:hypothetical protein